MNEKGSWQLHPNSWSGRSGAGDPAFRTGQCSPGDGGGSGGRVAGLGCLLATPGCLSHVFAAGLPPLKQLVDNFIEEGGRVLICTPCIKERHIEESELIPGMTPTAAGALIQEILTAKASLVY